MAKSKKKFNERLWVKIICFILAFAMVAGTIVGIIFLILNGFH